MTATFASTIVADASRKPVLDPNIIGLDDLQHDMMHALGTGRLGHAYLFAGPHGIGKRMTAVALARALVCERLALQPGPPCLACRQCMMVTNDTHPDVQVFRRDKAAMSVEFMRESILTWAARKPREGRVKVGIIDEAENLGTAAANAFLKTLEEPPQGTHWILLTGAKEETLSTIVSRCRAVHFHPLTSADMDRVLAGPLAAQLTSMISERDTAAEAEDRDSDDSSFGAGSHERGGVLSGAERRFVIDCSQGSPGQLLALVRNGVFAQYQWLQSVLTGRSRSDAITAADELQAMLTRAGEETQEGMRERLRGVIALAQSLIRDAAAHTGGEAAYTDNSHREGLLTLCDELEMLRQAVASNASPKLLTVNLVLGISRMLAR